MEEMEHYYITLYSVKEVIDDTPMGKFARMVLAFVAEMEREKIMDRTVTGKINKAQQGKVVSGNKTMYGWKWMFNDKGERDYIVLDEDATEVLRKAGQEYADGVSLRQILLRLEAEGVPSPGGKKWYPRTLRHILTDPRMTGKNVQIFTNHKKDAKQHLEPIDLPDDTYPRILSDEVYNKIVQRASINAAQASRNSKYPEMFLLRAGFAKCAYCEQTMMAKRVVGGNGNAWFAYTCPNRFGKCTRFAVSAHDLDKAVWMVMEQLADHVALIEESVRLAMQNHSLDEDLRATNAALDEWHRKIENYEGDLEDSNLRGDTRAGIRNMLNAAYAMADELEQQKTDLERHTIDRNKVYAEYEKVLGWCKQVKTERKELTYSQKRDFLYMVGANVLVFKLERQGAEPTWDIRVALPKVQEVIYQVGDGAIGNSLSRGRSGRAILRRFSLRTR